MTDPRARGGRDDEAIDGLYGAKQINHAQISNGGDALHVSLGGGGERVGELIRGLATRLSPRVESRTALLRIERALLETASPVWAG